MQINGLNINKIRDINKVRIMLGGQEFFSAYSSQPVGSFQTTIQTSSVTQQIGKLLTDHLPLVKGAWKAIQSDWAQTLGLGVVANQNGYAGNAGLNYDAMYAFTGTNYFQKQLQCYLQVENDFYEDVAQPLYKLLSFCLPSETQAALGGKNGVIDKTNQHLKDDGFFEEDASTIKNFLAWTWETIKDYGDSITLFKTPLQFAHSGHYKITVIEDGKPKVIDIFPDNGKTLFSIMIGKYIKISNVIINSISFDIPNLLTYEDGLFDRVNITLSLLGTRSMSIQTFDWVRELSATQQFNVVEDEAGDEKSEATLNKAYDNPAQTKVPNKDKKTII